MTFADHQQSSPYSPPVVRWSVGPFLELAHGEPVGGTEKQPHTDRTSDMSNAAAGQIQDGGEYVGTPCDPVYGDVKDRPYVHVAMQITEGPCKGLKLKYEVKKWDEKNIPYIRQDLLAAGWRGRSLRDFVDDVNAANKAGHKVQFTARLAEYEGRTWWTVGSIGYRTPQAREADRGMTADVDSWLGVPGENSSRPAPRQNSHPNAPDADDAPPPDADVPF